MLHPFDFPADELEKMKMLFPEHKFVPKGMIKSISNKNKGIATNAMATFLAINTSDVTIIPATVIAMRVSAESANPAAIIGTTIVATSCSTIAAIVASKTLQRMKRFQIDTNAEAK